MFHVAHDQQKNLDSSCLNFPLFDPDEFLQNLQSSEKYHAKVRVPFLILNSVHLGGMKSKAIDWAANGPQTFPGFMGRRPNLPDTKAKLVSCTREQVNPSAHFNIFSWQPEKKRH